MVIYFWASGRVMPFIFLVTWLGFLGYVLLDLVVFWVRWVREAYSSSSRVAAINSRFASMGFMVLLKVVLAVFLGAGLQVGFLGAQ